MDRMQVQKVMLTQYANAKQKVLLHTLAAAREETSAHRQRQEKFAYGWVCRQHAIELLAVALGLSLVGQMDLEIDEEVLA